MLAVLLAAIIQQAAPSGQVVWATPVTPPVVEAPVVIPTIPDWARADPHGYERSECSPLVRKADESMEACQVRVRHAIAANAGAAPVGGSEIIEECRQAVSGDRYALQCGAPQRSMAPGVSLSERTCESRPEALPQGGVVWTEKCRPADGSQPAEGGLRFRLGGDND